MGVTLGRTQFDQLVSILENSPALKITSSRTAFVEEVLSGSSRESVINPNLNLDGVPHDVAVHLVTRLAADENGQALLCRLIELLCKPQGMNDSADILNGLRAAICNPRIDQPSNSPKIHPPTGNLIDSVKRYLVEANAQAASLALGGLVHAQVDQLQDRDMTWLILLTRIATSRLDDASQASILTNNQHLLPLVIAEWPDEVAGTLVCAMKNTRKKNEVAEDIRRILGQFPLHCVAIKSLRNLFLRQWNEIQPIPLQGSSQSNTPKQNKPSTYLHPTAGHSQQLVPQKLLLHGRAEYEETTLFGETRGFFWAKHPIYGNIAQTPGNHFVYGEPGCGRTTLALALRYGKCGTTNHLNVYARLGNNDVWATIQRSCADILLEYVCDKGTRLFLLGESQRTLLAHVLLQAIPFNSVKARLDRMLDARSKEAASNEEGYQFRQLVKEDQHALLVQALTEARKSSSASIAEWDREWVRSVVDCCKFLGHCGIQLLLDCTTVPTNHTRLLEALDEWQDHGVTCTLFMPTSAFQTVQNNVRQDNIHELTWNEEQLGFLLHHLLRVLTGSRNIGEYFEDGALSAFIRAITPPTPRQMVKLWCDVLQGVDTKVRRISVEAIDRLWHP